MGNAYNTPADRHTVYHNMHMRYPIICTECIFYFIGHFSPNTLPPINHFYAKSRSPPHTHANSSLLQSDRSVGRIDRQLATSCIHRSPCRHAIEWPSDSQVLPRISLDLARQTSCQTMSHIMNEYERVASVSYVRERVICVVNSHTHIIVNVQVIYKWYILHGSASGGCDAYGVL